MCVISACKSAIVSPNKPALYGTQISPVLNLVHVLVVRICLTSEPDCIITPLPLQIRQSCHYDDPRVNKLHNSRQHTQTVSPIIITTVF